VGRDEISGIQGSSAKRWTEPRKRKVNMESARRQDLAVQQVDRCVGLLGERRAARPRPARPTRAAPEMSLHGRNLMELGDAPVHFQRRRSRSSRVRQDVSASRKPRDRRQPERHACSGSAPPPNESRHPMAWPPASTAPLQAAEPSQAFPRWTASPRPIAAGSPPSPSAKVRAVSRGRTSSPRARRRASRPSDPPVSEQSPCPALGSLAATNQASWNASALFAAQRAELSGSAFTSPALRPGHKGRQAAGHSPRACLT